MKRYFCDHCGKEIDLDHGGFAEMRVQWWSRGEGKAELMEYKPDYRHRDGDEDFMLCAHCCNEFFEHIEGMEDA